MTVRSFRSTGYFPSLARKRDSRVRRVFRFVFVEARRASVSKPMKLGMSVAAKMPMMEMTMRSSSSVKPDFFILNLLRYSQYFAHRGHSLDDLFDTRVTQGPHPALHRLVGDDDRGALPG